MTDLEAPTALSMAMDVLEKCKSDGDIKGQVQAMLNIALTYSYEGDKTKAVTTYHEAKELAAKDGDLKGQCVALMGAAEVHFADESGPEPSTTSEKVEAACKKFASGADAGQEAAAFLKAMAKSFPPTTTGKGMATLMEAKELCQKKR